MLVFTAHSSTGREVGPGTGVVIVYAAVGNRHCAHAIVNTATLATRGKIVCKLHRVVAYNAIHDRQCCVALIAGIVVDTTPSIKGTVPGDSAVKDRQCRAACEPSL